MTRIHNQYTQTIIHTNTHPLFDRREVRIGTVIEGHDCSLSSVFFIFKLRTTQERFDDAKRAKQRKPKS